MKKYALFSIIIKNLLNLLLKFCTDALYNTIELVSRIKNGAEGRFARHSNKQLQDSSVLEREEVLKSIMGGSKSMKQLHWKKCLMAVAIAFAGVLGAASFGPTGMTAQAYAGGTGTASDPYQISDAEQFDIFTQENGVVYGKLIADIAYSGARGGSKKLVLDLNGKSITGTGSETSVLNVGTGGSLTIRDSSIENTGCINRSSTMNQCTIQVNGGSLILESGSIGGTSAYGIFVQSGSAIIKGGTVTGNAEYEFHKGVMSSAGEVSILEYAIVLDGVTADGTSTVNISDYAKIGAAISKTASATVNLYGGYYTQSEGELRDTVTKIDDENCTVTSSNIVGYTTWIKVNDTAVPAFNGHRVVLGDQIELLFYVDLPGGAASYPSSYVTFEGNNGKISKTVATPATPESGISYPYSIKLSSIEMADAVTPTFHYFVGEEEQTIVGDPYCVADYINWAVGAGKTTLTTKQLTIVKALADYGYYAQPYLARVNSWTDGVDHTKMPFVFTNQYTYSDIRDDVDNLAFIKNVDEAVVSEIQYTLRFGATTSIIICLTPAEEVSINSVEVDNQSVTPTYSNGKYYIVIPDILASDLTTMHDVKVGTQTSQVSPMSYVYSVLRDGSTFADDAKDLVSAFYKYAVACQ